MTRSLKLFATARHSPASLRKLLALLMLAFAFVTISHAGHRHDLDDRGGTHSICDYCATFGNLADAPVQAAVALSSQRTAAPLEQGSSEFVCSKIKTSAQPRAPPSC